MGCTCTSGLCTCVCACVCLSVLQSELWSLAGVFPIVVLDECSQMTEPSSVFALLRAKARCVGGRANWT